MDDLDRALLALLQRDASQPYAALGQAVGLSPGAAHERVRKLRERGVIRRTTIEVDPAAVGRSVLAFVMVRAGAWMGDPGTRAALAALPEVQEAHVIAGPATLFRSQANGSCRVHAVSVTTLATTGDGAS